MDMFEAVQKRCSVRAYLPDPVPKDALERILEAGRLAPSAMNLQPWHFIVVMDQQKREAISAGRFAHFLSQTPVVIVGCGNRSASPKGCVVDTTIALENMVLVATGEGIGTCWIGSFDEEHVKVLLKIPEDFTVVAMLAVGYPREKPTLMERAIRFFRQRRDMEEIVSAEEFGKPFQPQFKEPGISGTSCGGSSGSNSIRTAPGRYMWPTASRQGSTGRPGSRSATLSRATWRVS